MRILSTALILLVLAGCQSSSVTVDYDTATDFSTIHRYSWYQKTSGVEKGLDPLMAARTHNAVKTQLRALSLQPASRPEQADVLVRYYVGSRTQSQPSKSRGSIGLGGGTGGAALGLALSFPLGGDKLVKEVEIVVDLLNPTSKKLIWRGTNRLQIGEETPQQITAQVNTAVAEIFSKYPPAKSAH